LYCDRATISPDPTQSFVCDGLSGAVAARNGVARASTTRFIG
jgi:hypothetical protein